MFLGLPVRILHTGAGGGNNPAISTHDPGAHPGCVLGILRRATSRTASPSCEGGFKRVGPQDMDFKIREEHLGGQFRGFSAQQSHQQQADG